MKAIMRNMTQRHCKIVVPTLVTVLALVVALGLLASQMQTTLGSPIDAMKPSVNGKPTEDGTSSDKPIRVKTGDEITYEITLDKPAIPATVPNPTFQPKLSSPAKINFTNGSFEKPTFDGGYAMASQNMVPGWNTRPTKASEVNNSLAYYIEIQKPNALSGFAKFCPDGTQYAELNAHVEGTLYQNCETKPGTKIYYEFYHSTRMSGTVTGPDVLNFYLRKAGATTGGLQVKSTAYWPNWIHNTGSYIVPAGQTSTEFAFESASAAAGDVTAGNYLDAIRLYTQSYLDITKSNNASAGKASLGDTVTYTTKVKNTGESDASHVKLSDILPAGTELVSGSVKVGGVTTNNFNYDAATRKLSVNVGQGASASDGGLIKGNGSFSPDCFNEYVVTYDVTVKGIIVAENFKCESQVKATYEDRYDTARGLYTNYSNVDAFQLDKNGFVTVTDIFPEEMSVLSADSGAVIDGQKVTWDLSGAATGKQTVKVTAKINEPDADMIFTNEATISINGQGDFQTNIVYHILKGTGSGGTTPGTGKKTASIDDGTFETGSEDNRIEVKAGNKITYKIDVEKPETIEPNTKYDVLFVLDWSVSMGKDMVTGQSARLYARSIMQNMSEFIFENYPDSRVALLGANNTDSPNSNCYNDPRYANLQLQTEFLTESQYHSQIDEINDAFTNPTFIQDDNAQYLAAAVNTMKSTPTTYGQLAGEGNQKTTVRRDAGISDVSERIPVIVHIADFQISEEIGLFNRTNNVNSNSEAEGYWSASMKRQADAFHDYSVSEYRGKGVLLTIRMDTAQNVSFSFNSETYNDLMRDNVVPAARGWGFIPVANGTPYTEVLADVKADFFKRVPVHDTHFAVTDRVPEGLTVDTSSISHDGTYNASARTITWDLTDSEKYSSDEYPLTFDTTVDNAKGARTYDNQAIVEIGVSKNPTNQTYHQLQKKEDSKTNTLHLRQVILNQNKTVELPYKGYFTLKNDGKSFNLTTESNKEGVEVPFKTVNIALDGTSKVCDIDCILPQNYDYSGYVASNSYADGSHNPANSLSNQAKADFSQGNEIWVTVYLTPRDNPGQYSWDFMTNDFGTITHD